VVSTTQATYKVKTTIGIEKSRDTILIVHFVTDEDGSLKLIKREDFMDSKAELDFAQAVTATGAAAKKQ
jgi:hypothetical protein